MTDFLSRYQNGEHEAVWDELIALGSAVSQEPLRSEAWAVACETMRRARHNIEILVPRLEQLGYQFGALPDDVNYWKKTPVVSPPTPETGALIKEIESLIGPLPLSLRAWLEIVGAVNLVGFHPQWPETEVLDPMWVGHAFVDSGEDWKTNLHLEFEEWQENQQQEDEEDREDFVLELSPDFFHKANISGDPAYGIPLPSEAADTHWVNYWKDTTFVGYLRDCFRWGGFPGLQGHDKIDEFTFQKDAEEHLQFVRTTLQMPADHLSFLTRDLLPL